MKKFKWLVPTIYIIFLMLPIYWLLNMSFKTTTEIINTYSLWPQKFTFENYITIFTDSTWYTGYLNSIYYVVMNTVLSVAAALPAAYALNGLVVFHGYVGRGSSSPPMYIQLGIVLSCCTTECVHLPSDASGPHTAD